MAAQHHDRQLSEEDGRHSNFHPGESYKVNLILCISQIPYTYTYRHTHLPFPLRYMLCISVRNALLALLGRPVHLNPVAAHIHHRRHTHLSDRMLTQADIDKQAPATKAWHGCEC